MICLINFSYTPEKIGAKIIAFLGIADKLNPAVCIAREHVCKTHCRKSTKRKRACKEAWDKVFSVFFYKIITKQTKESMDDSQENLFVRMSEEKKSYRKSGNLVN